MGNIALPYITLLSVLHSTWFDNGQETMDYWFECEQNELLQAKLFVFPGDLSLVRIIQVSTKCTFQSRYGPASLGYGL